MRRLAAAGWSPPLLLLAAFLAVSSVVLSAGAAFVASDEAVGYLLARGVAENGEPIHRFPHGDLTGRGFGPMGSDGGPGEATGRVSTPFVVLFALPTMAGPAGALAGALLATLALLVAVYLTARRLLGRAGALVALAGLAFAPPLLFFSTLFFSNVPSLALFALGLLLLAVHADTGRPSWLLASLGVVILAASLRLDGVLLVLPLALFVLLRGLGRPAWLGMGALLAYATLVLFQYSFGAEGWRAFVPFGDPGLIKGAAQGTHAGGWRWDLVPRYARDHVLGHYPLLALAGGAGALALAFRRREHAWLVAGLLGGALVIVGFFFTMEQDFRDPPGLFSSPARYTLVLPLAFALLAGALAARASRAFQGRGRAAFVAAFVVLLALPGLVHASLAEPGLGWLRHERAERAALAEAVGALPEGAYLVSDEQSKFVFTLPVLAPWNVREAGYYVPRIVDAVSARNGTAYIHESTFLGDWSGPVGDFVADDYHTTMETGHAGFLRVLRTETHLQEVGILGEGHWNLTEEGFLRSQARYSYVRPTPTLMEALRTPPTPGALVTMIVRDSDREWHEAGYVKAPLGPNDVVVAHRWLGTGSGLLRAERFFVPADTLVNGPFYASAGLTFLAFRIEPLPGVVAR